MNDHWPDIRPLFLSASLLIGRDILQAGSVAVAVGQYLAAFSEGPGQLFLHLGVGKNGVAPFSVRRPLVGFPHPGGTALGRTIQKHFITAYPKTGLIAGRRKGFQQPLAVVHIPVGHQIQLQFFLAAQLLVKGDHAVYRHTVLHCGDAIAEIAVLRLLKGPH